MKVPKRTWFILVTLCLCLLWGGSSLTLAQNHRNPPSQNKRTIPTSTPANGKTDNAKNSSDNPANSEITASNTNADSIKEASLLKISNKLNGPDGLIAGMNTIVNELTKTTGANANDSTKSPISEKAQRVLTDLQTLNHSLLEAQKSFDAKNYKEGETELSGTLFGILPMVIMTLVLAGLTVATYLMLKRNLDFGITLIRNASGAVDAQRGDLARLKSKLDQLPTARSVQPVQQQQGAQVQPSYPREQARTPSPSYESYEPAPKRIELPFALEEYYVQYGPRGTRLNVDKYTGDLTEDPEGKFLLVQNSRLGSGRDNILPAQDRIRQAQAVANYAKCYDCLRPASGKIYIKKLPAVQRYGNVWQVIEKGEMEVREM